MKLLIIGDPHLEKNASLAKPVTGSIFNSRVIDRLNLLDWALDQALEHGVSDIVVTGDICESSNPPFSLLEAFINFLKKCEVENIHVHIVGGNHDFKKTGDILYSYLDILNTVELPLVTVYKDVSTLLFDGLGVTFLPYRDRRILNTETTSEALNSIINTVLYEGEGIPSHFKKLLIGHFALEGALYTGDEIDNTANELILPLTTFESYDYVWMGHVHPAQILSKKPHIAHIGSMDISDFGEIDQIKIIIIYDSETDKFQEIPIPTRPLKAIEISVPEIEQDPTGFVKNHLATQDLKNAIVRLSIELCSENLPHINRKEIEGYLYDNGVHNVSGIHEAVVSSAEKANIEFKLEDKINYSDAIKSYAEIQVFSSDKEKELFLERGNGYIKEIS